ncbi:MANSC domain-containing protein 4 isoform X2 [Cygnus atratus]|uniref:MANSC domain-containing protein 4 isoform X2 n=1 Tax=Cygnus atratus TaxID=8868 RepID=UPI0015D58ED4|nr:MANSC domain-containing protein 4 isoform X2 [Cygnus atratus]
MKRIASNMKCWFDTGQRFRINSKSLLIPPCGAHGTVCHWIAGLLIDLQESQKRGAQVLKIYAEVSSQQCSRNCCLQKNVSCNLAVFYHGATHENMNCLHMSCPSLESCIIKARINVVLYNIKTGIDPDLLIFEKAISKEPNMHSSPNKYERQNSTKTTEWERRQHGNVTSSSLLLLAPSSTTGHGLTANTYTSSTNLTVEKKKVITYSREETSPLDDHLAKRTCTTSVSTRSTTSSDKRTVHSTLISKSADVLSHMPTPPHLNSSKQHLNETKGYSGRNYTSDNEVPAWDAAPLGVWLIPVVLCSSLIFLCCCTVALAAGRCRNRKGQYNPIWRGRPMSRRVIKYTSVKGSL